MTITKPVIDRNNFFFLFFCFRILSYLTFNISNSSLLKIKVLFSSLIFFSFRKFLILSSNELSVSRGILLLSIKSIFFFCNELYSSSKRSNYFSSKFHYNQLSILLTRKNDLSNFYLNYLSDLY